MRFILGHHAYMNQFFTESKTYSTTMSLVAELMTFTIQIAIMNQKHKA